MVSRSLSAFRLRVAAASAGLFFLAGAALGYEARLEGPLDEDLAELLKGGSLLIEQAEAEEPLDVREIVSTAQADYKRLLAVLYDQGYFGPTIRIRLDGQEAADILAVSPPRRVSVAVINVDSFRPGGGRTSGRWDGSAIGFQNRRASRRQCLAIGIAGGGFALA